jgi:tagatose-6-phosphate ketose/aldose isomerase
VAYDARLKSTTSGKFTIEEIRQQPDTWRETAGRVRKASVGALSPPVITGAGTSAYAAMAIEAAWPGSRAVPSTELFLDFEAPLAHRNLVVSLARSGNSPESVAVVEKIQRRLPHVRHVALTCNADGQLANWPGVQAILLDPRSNDRSLVMTSSFSNLVLAGLCLARPNEVEEALPVLYGGANVVLEQQATTAEVLAENPPRRFVALASTPLFGAAREACLKVVEMTSGRIATLAETYLGLRHGPMSFIEPETLVICFLSSDPRRRRYEMDLVAELHAKKIGRLLALGPFDVDAAFFERVISTNASSLPDYLRTPAEIVFCQLLGYFLSLRVGLDPDNPSPGGVIHRVVQGVRIYED